MHLLQCLAILTASGLVFDEFFLIGFSLLSLANQTGRSLCHNNPLCFLYLENQTGLGHKNLLCLPCFLYLKNQTVQSLDHNNLLWLLCLCCFLCLLYLENQTDRSVDHNDLLSFLYLENQTSRSLGHENLLWLLFLSCLEILYPPRFAPVSQEVYWFSPNFYWVQPDGLSFFPPQTKFGLRHHFYCLHRFDLDFSHQTELEE